jgi:hypothetical protein
MQEQSRQTNIKDVLTNNSEISQLLSTSYVVFAS